MERIWFADICAFVENVDNPLPLVMQLGLRESCPDIVFKMK